MTAPEKAIESRDVRLTPDEIAKLKGICARTLSAQPQLAHWLKNIEVAPGVELPFLPIRCFRLLNVSRFLEPEENSKPEWIAEFLSSGSTQAQRARHRMSNEGLESYRQSALQGWQNACKRLGIPPQTPVLSLVPPGESIPDSSLSMMLSFWRDAGVPVHFVDLTSSPQMLESCFKQLQQRTGRLPEFILFGTSLHHLQVLQWQQNVRPGQPFLDAVRVWCFDTGGTKGRTQSTHQAELHSGLRSWFPRHTQVGFLSEYGMCELASQAYSLQSPHSDSFACSPQLRAVAVAPKMNCILAHEHNGFLGFIDFANTDSWPCLISEDLGMTLSQPEFSFRLSGRAPDATLKGCSLNVRDTYRFDLESPPSASIGEYTEVLLQGSHAQPQARAMLSAEKLLQSLPAGHWPAPALNDLRASLSGWDTDQAAIASSPKKLTDEHIAIVTSANIPITWLFPAVHAWLMNARDVTLYLPSLRPDDPLTALVRKQIVDLAEAFNQQTAIDFIQVRNHRLFQENSNKNNSNQRILVFGSDETIRTLSSACARLARPPHFIPLGHFQNALKLTETSHPGECAELCSLWLGRGCLTPLQLEAPRAWTSNFSRTFAAELFSRLIETRKKRIEAAESCGVDAMQAFSHQHNLAELYALVASHSLDLDVKHCSLTGTVVVNATQCATLPPTVVSKLTDFSGCGWINLVNDGQLTPLPEHNPCPGLCEPHQGMSWYNWFFRTMPSGA